MDAVFWHETHARFRDSRAVIKLLNKDGSFNKSIMIPTVSYPLNGKYEYFTYKNTEPVTDEAVLKIFDETKYRIGFCYTNVEELLGRLKASGYDAKSYVGWLFTGATEYPVHHCWVVLNGNMILDLADDMSVMLSGQNGECFKNVKSMA